MQTSQLSTPIVRILRGIAGSGKSTYAEQWLTASQYGSKTVETFSADAYFYINNEYLFDPKRLGDAHAWCLKRFLDRLHYDNAPNTTGKAPDVLLVDNTNISAFEIAPYVAAATAFGLPHEILTIWCDPAVAASRCVHGVPPHVIHGMYAKLLREELPPFWNHQVIYPKESKQ